MAEPTPPAALSPAQAALLCALRTYKDLLWPARPYPADGALLTQADPVMDAYLVHIASHIVAAAARVLDTIDSIHANQRPHLAFAALFSDLGGDG